MLSKEKESKFRENYQRGILADNIVRCYYSVCNREIFKLMIIKDHSYIAYPKNQGKDDRFFDSALSIKFLIKGNVAIVHVQYLENNEERLNYYLDKTFQAPTLNPNKVLKKARQEYQSNHFERKSSPIFDALPLEINIHNHIQRQYCEEYKK